MKRSFVKQYDDNGCGPIAIINAKRWQNKETPFYKYLLEKCKTGSEGYEGTLQENIHRVIKMHFNNVNCTNSPKRIKFALESGRGVILLFRFEYKGDKGDHYTFVCKNKNGIWVSNDEDKCVLGPFKWNTFKKEYLSIRESRKTYKMVFPTAWVISK